MSSVQDQIECKQCHYPEADYTYYCRVAEDSTVCRRCGYHESWTAKRDQEGVPCGWIHEIDQGFGALSYGWKDGGGFTTSCLQSAQQLAEAERWLRERLAKGEGGPQNYYLTRWNKETKKVELVIGEFEESPESVAENVTGEEGKEIRTSG